MEATGRWFGGGTSQTTVFRRLGGRRGASRRKTIVAWVSFLIFASGNFATSGVKCGRGTLLVTSNGRFLLFRHDGIDSLLLLFCQYLSTIELIMVWSSDDEEMIAWPLQKKYEEEECAKKCCIPSWWRYLRLCLLGPQVLGHWRRGSWWPQGFRQIKILQGSWGWPWFVRNLVSRHGVRWVWKMASRWAVMKKL